MQSRKRRFRSKHDRKRACLKISPVSSTHYKERITRTENSTWCQIMKQIFPPKLSSHSSGCPPVWQKKFNRVPISSWHTAENLIRSQCYLPAHKENEEPASNSFYVITWTRRICSSSHSANSTISLIFWNIINVRNRAQQQQKREIK